MKPYVKDLQYYKFCLYGFFKNLRLIDAFLMLFFLEKGIGFFEIGILYSIRELITMIMEIPSGVISDAIGRRKTLIASFIIYIISFIVFYVSFNYEYLIIAMALFAVADASRTGVHKAMIFQYLLINNWQDYKIDYYGHTRSWSQTGSAISSLIAAIFVFLSGSYNIIFIASIIPYLADMILVYSYPTYLDGETSIITGTKIINRFKIVINAAIQTIKNFDFFKILTNLSLYTGYNKSVKDYIQPILKYIAIGMPFFAYMDNEKKTAIIIGVVYFIIYILTALASRLSGKFIKLFKQLEKPMNLTLIIGFIFGIISGLGAIIGIYVIPVIGFLVIIIIENLRKPIGIGIVADLSNNSSMATTLSITSQAKSFFAAILAPIIGYLADFYNPGVALLSISTLLLLLLPIYWLRNNSKKKVLN